MELTKFSQNAQGMVDSHLRLGGGDWRQFCCFFEQGLLGWVTGHVKMREKGEKGLSSLNASFGTGGITGVRIGEGDGRLGLVSFITGGMHRNCGWSIIDEKREVNAESSKFHLDYQCTSTYMQMHGHEHSLWNTMDMWIHGQ